MKNTRQNESFQYGKSSKISFWGNQFDSVLELKYVLSIQDEYEYLRARITIYYHHGTLLPARYIREGVRHYTPDFLIRHKQTGKAFLIETKPRAAQNDKRLILRKQVAEKFITAKGYDWTFNIVFDDEITLDAKAQTIFNACRKLSKRNASYGLPGQILNRSSFCANSKKKILILSSLEIANKKHCDKHENTKQSHADRLPREDPGIFQTAIGVVFDTIHLRLISTNDRLLQYRHKKQFTIYL